MKLTATVIASLCLLGSVLSYKDIEILKVITNECLIRLPNLHYDYRSGAYKPVAYTLESFISLIEKLEHHDPHINIFDLTNLLLERFYFSEILLQPDGSTISLSRDTNKIHRSDFLNKLLGKRNDNGKEAKEYFNNIRDLSDDDKCSLYFMIGHNINNTYRQDFDSRMVSDPSSSEQPSGSNNVVKIPTSVRPREQGLVSLHSDSVNAVAMGRVLVGIAAGEYKDQTRKQYQHIDPDAVQKNPLLQGQDIDVVTSLTVGDAIAHAEIEKRSPDVTKYGPPGTWNTTSCPTEYKLKSDKITTTDAELRGSIDGYILGEKVNDINGRVSNLKLSQLLRMFYSRQGIALGTSTSTSTSTRLGFCERSNYMGSFDETNLRKYVDGVIAYYRAKLGRPTDIPNWYDDYKTYINSKLRAEEPQESICKERFDTSLTTQYDSKLPEQPIDIFVVLDVTEQATRGMQEQIDVLGHLSGYLDIAYGAGSMTVLLNSRSQPNMNELYNATNSGCVTCTLERMEQSEFRHLERDTVAGTLERLNSTLQTYEISRALEEAVPAKVVIYFHYDTNAQEDEKKLEEASRQLRYHHRDVQIFAIGSGQVLEKIASDANTIYNQPTSPKNRADSLRKEIRKVPATLQYHECGNRAYRGEENHVFRGYVTPDEKQLWAMYPEYFLKSFNIEIKFKAENGKIRVCYDRGFDDPSLSIVDEKSKTCKQTENSGSELVFNMTNPCERRNVFTCNPFNFAIIGLPAEGVNNPTQCTDANCRRFDQIKFTVTHKGIRCNGALGLLASPFLLVAAAYAMLRNHL